MMPDNRIVFRIYASPDERFGPDAFTIGQQVPCSVGGGRTILATIVAQERGPAGEYVELTLAGPFPTDT